MPEPTPFPKSLANFALQLATVLLLLLLVLFFLSLGANGPLVLLLLLPFAAPLLGIDQKGYLGNVCLTSRKDPLIESSSLRRQTSPSLGTHPTQPRQRPFAFFSGPVPFLPSIHTKTLPPTDPVLVQPTQTASPTGTAARSPAGPTLVGLVDRGGRWLPLRLGAAGQECQAQTRRPLRSTSSAEGPSLADARRRFPYPAVDLLPATRSVVVLLWAPQSHWCHDDDEMEYFRCRHCCWLNRHASAFRCRGGVQLILSLFPCVVSVLGMDDLAFPERKDRSFDVSNKNKPVDVRGILERVQQKANVFRTTFSGCRSTAKAH